MGSIRGMRLVAVLATAAAMLVAGCGRDEEESGGGGGGGGAAPGVTDTSIKLGTTFPLSGPASAYATISRAQKAYFDYTNSKGGVNGRKIEYVVLDDGYDPAKSVTNARRLVTQEKVFAVYSPLGTPNNLAIWDYLNQQKVPQVFVATGATEFGADPEKHPYTIGWQPDYRTEARAYGDFVKKEKPNAKVAVLYQNDAYGKGLLSGFEERIKGSKVKIVARESYEVTDPTVAPQVAKLAQSGADTMLTITTPKPGAQAVGAVAKSGWKPFHILNNVAASKSLVLKPVGLKAAEGLYTMQYFKDPESEAAANDPDMKEFKAQLKKYSPRADINESFNAYGWASAATLVEALKQAGKDLDREKFMEAVRNLDAKVPLVFGNIKTGEGDAFPIETVQIAQFKDEAWQPVGDLISSEGEAGQ